MEDDEQRYEYVINDSGKVYTGGYKNVRGRPWIYGQFDDCVLPAACVMLEMSGLTHAERGNPVKVTRALSSMVWRWLYLIVLRGNPVKVTRALSPMV